MKFKKLLISFTMAMVLMSLISGTFSVFAYDSTDVTETESTEDSISISTFAEITEWRYRKYNGVWQKRLWSVTYGKWLTAWTNL